MGKQSIHDVKTYHMYQICWNLVINGNATMQELIQSTGLSQPSVRNMIRELQKLGLIQEIGNDLSTGGRCPTRFGLVENYFQFICLYIHERYVEYQIVSYQTIVIQSQFDYKNEEELIVIVQDLIDKYHSQYCVIAVKGMVNDNLYITDHHGFYQENKWISKLKELISIPIALENDVKTMQLGRLYQGYGDNSIYLYINEVGVGCSYMQDGKLFNGEHGLSGEIGLIPYHNQTINQCIRNCQDQKEFMDLIVYLFIIVYSFMDPKHVDLSCDNKLIDINVVKNQLIKHLPHYQPFDMSVIDNSYQDLVKGLEYLGIHSILKKITEERK